MLVLPWFLCMSSAKFKRRVLILRVSNTEKRFVSVIAQVVHSFHIHFEARLCLAVQLVANPTFGS